MSIVVVEFTTKYKGETAVDWVLLAPRGESFQKTQTWYSIPSIDPANAKPRLSAEMREVMHARWQIIEPAYRAWKVGQDIPEDGTPLAAWAGVTPEQAKHLRAMGIKSVEDVAAMNDSAAGKLPFPGRKQLPEMARMFLDDRGKAAVSGELAAANERIAAMEAMMVEMQAEKSKRGPGRPKKEEAAA